METRRAPLLGVLLLLLLPAAGAAQHGVGQRQGTGGQAGDAPGERRPGCPSGPCRRRGYTVHVPRAPARSDVAWSESSYRHAGLPVGRPGRGLTQGPKAVRREAGGSVPRAAPTGPSEHAAHAASAAAVAGGGRRPGRKPLVAVVAPPHRVDVAAQHAQGVVRVLLLQGLDGAPAIVSGVVDEVVEHGHALVGHAGRQRRGPQGPPLAPFGEQHPEEALAVRAAGTAGARGGRGGGGRGGGVHAPEAQDAAVPGAQLRLGALQRGPQQLLFLVVQRRRHRRPQPRAAVVQAVGQTLQRRLLHQAEAHRLQHPQVVLATERPPGGEGTYFVMLTAIDVLTGSHVFICLPTYLQAHLAGVHLLGAVVSSAASYTWSSLSTSSSWLPSARSTVLGGSWRKASVRARLWMFCTRYRWTLACSCDRPNRSASLCTSRMLLSSSQEKRNSQQKVTTSSICGHTCGGTSVMAGGEAALDNVAQPD
ncbi:LOW QUALITY PROTEIN: hypothetical protein CRUP_006908 [Coryphaenoides rupestris]|nr:LOW QUALITY PROTEIN: hypothetical protein CRUP_006908 [Coryphaenoides rupestris]